MSWPNIIQKGFPRSLSDHCPITFSETHSDWGPKPFRTLDCWFNHPDFKSFVESQWSTLTVTGKASFVIKEKLKTLKGKLKGWNKECLGLIDHNIDKIQEETHNLDMRIEAGSYVETYIERMKFLNSELWQLSRRKENLTYQKSRSKWVRDGDTNSKNCHTLVNSQRKHNEILGLSIKGRWVDNPEEVKLAVYKHFSEQFSNSS